MNAMDQFKAMSVGLRTFLEWSEGMDRNKSPGRGALAPLPHVHIGYGNMGIENKETGVLRNPEKSLFLRLKIRKQGYSFQETQSLTHCYIILFGRRHRRGVVA